MSIESVNEWVSEWNDGDDGSSGEQARKEHLEIRQQSKG